MKLTAGQKILAIYFSLFYFFPLLGNLVFQDQIYSIYRNEEISWWLAFNIFFVFAALMLLSMEQRLTWLSGWIPTTKKFQFWRSACDTLGRFYQSKRLWLSFGIFLVSAFFSFNGHSTYRYGYIGISVNGSYFLIFSILVSTYVIVDLFYHMFITRNRDVPFWGRFWFENVFMALSAVLFADGTSSSFLAMLGCFYAFFPKWFNQLWFLDVGAGFKDKAVQFLKVFPICVVLFLLAWTQGEFIKVSSGKIKPPEGFGTGSVVKVAHPKEQYKLVIAEGPKLGMKYPMYHLMRDELLHEILAGNRSVLGGLIEYNEFLAQRRQAVIIGYFDRFARGLKRLLTEGRLFGEQQKKKDSYVMIPEPDLEPPPISGGPSRGLLHRIMDKLTNKLEFLKYGQGEILSMKYIYYLVERFSSHLYSYNYTLTQPFGGLQWKDVRAVFIPLKSFLFRADYLTGGFFGVEKPAVASVSQLNYRMLVREHFRSREGTSPGLLGSFNYLLPWPLNLVLALIYMLFLVQLFNVLFSNVPGKQISFLGLVIVLHVFQNFMDSPVDFLMIVDNSFMKVLVILLIYWALKSTKDGAESPPLKVNN